MTNTKKYRVEVSLDYQIESPTDILIQLELDKSEAAGQLVEDESCLMTEFDPGEARMPGENDIGVRFWLSGEGQLKLDYSATYTPTRPDIAHETLSILRPADLPSDTIRYLMPSRYCEVGEFQRFVMKAFGDYQDGEKIVAMREWISDNYDYEAGASDVETSAKDSFAARAGVCRDYAHTIISFARAAAIPARMASVYAPRVDPPDFHAVAQLYLADSDGKAGWHFVDPTGMASADEIGLIGVGRDASDISFMTSYGPVTLKSQSVEVRPADG